MSIEINQKDLDDFIAKYYIVRNGSYYPKISIGAIDNVEIEKMTIEDVKDHFLKKLSKNN